MSWITLLDDSRFLSNLFPNSVPSLDGLVLHEVRLLRDGPIALIRFDLGDFPTLVPRKWQGKGFNVVQVALMGVGMHSFSLSGWGTHNSVSLQFDSEDRRIGFLATGEANLKCAASFDRVRVDAVSAYRNSC